MSVRQSLLAILDQAPCYGYQLRTEFERRTGGAWALNVGQIYNTLERLERDGLVTRGAADEHGHVYWEISDAGRQEVRAWLATGVDRSQAARDELAMKLSLAATLPGVDAAAVIRTQRGATVARLEELRRARGTGSDSAAPEAIARSLVLDAMIFAAEAEARWLDHAEAELAAHPDHALALDLSTDRPRRGRPARAAA
ncbi:PadR family transcriptional regulator [Microbacterium paludicola]|uniref:PadR family transcriptional regulator n=1 Tax=Microbacterium paludicola TaxID=300019 RepID=A0A4Y9G105_9MICO|nr:PadR family transcriptional regulator [Microbacterium paludicola]MBF0815173.1 PadR family transcriptional regulator [Microbacterium paludicola]TFU34431.1 PadR family transcriptional regulator [Microbacterium paludicola]